MCTEREFFLFLRFLQNWIVQPDAKAYTNAKGQGLEAHVEKVEECTSFSETIQPFFKSETGKVKLPIEFENLKPSFNVFAVIQFF